eukprot:CAMPEP_0116125622 /NCGR_PEP_ID=MMETSP0329-20121206/5907_1 /TAXON_ID=697910 /ORGANISM="Pseudo-nitzschia arenysensis, Strain B593" /LENGTH=625 /DNA_ID=CAMNT_0003619671 /DNA_START=213 /DNA_END=2090 /DNA_ORIENTATION=-
MSSKSRCKICYQRERRNDPTAKSTDIKRRCANPTNGCVVCNVYVCSTCWPIHVEEVLKQRGMHNEDNTTGQNIYPDRSGSLVVESFLAINNSNWNSFLQTRWERKTQLFTYDAEIPPISSNLNGFPTVNASLGHLSSTETIPTRTLVPPIYAGDGCWRENSMDVFPLRESIRQGWHILTTFMTADYDNSANEMTTTEPTMHVRILNKSQPISRDEIKKLYNGDLYEVYLSGCSITWENCDLQSPYIASLCNDLEGKHGNIGDQDKEQQEGSAFDKTYATAHLDPPQHAESSAEEITTDQNIFVFQLVGRKYWKTYWKMPIDDSSESKDGEEASPASICWKSMSFEGFLYPGDILYIPKGMCYQCQAQKPSGDKSNGKDSIGSDLTMSFDVIIAAERSSGTITKSIEKTAPIDQEDTAMPDAPSSNDAAEEGTNEKQKQQQEDKDKDEDGAKENNIENNERLSRKRNLIIQKARETSPAWLKSQKTNSDEQEESTTPPVDAKPKKRKVEDIVGPAIASQISFRTAVRTPTNPEQVFCKNLLNQKLNDINKRRDEGIRSELRGVAKVIATMVRTMTTGDGRMRVCDLCELVKQAFGDKVEDYLVCELSMLALIKREIESGKLAVHTL